MPEQHAAVYNSCTIKFNSYPCPIRNLDLSCIMFYFVVVCKTFIKIYQPRPLF